MAPVQSRVTMCWSSSILTITLTRPGMFQFMQDGVSVPYFHGVIPIPINLEAMFSIRLQARESFRQKSLATPGVVHLQRRVEDFFLEGNLGSTR